MYHGEDEQEDFLVLAGECLLLIEGEERLAAAVGLRPLPAVDRARVRRRRRRAVRASRRRDAIGRGVIYPRSEVALRHKAGVEQETREPREAYADIKPDVAVGYRAGWLEGR